MTTAVWIYLVTAAVFAAFGVTAFRHANRRPTTITDERLAEIQADIEVYDFADGVEVNRRPAYPVARLARSVREMGAAANQLHASFDEIAAKFAEMSFALKRTRETPGPRVTVSNQHGVRDDAALRRWTDGVAKGPW